MKYWPHILNQPIERKQGRNFLDRLDWRGGQLRILGITIGWVVVGVLWVQKGPEWKD